MHKSKRIIQIGILLLALGGVSVPAYASGVSKDTVSFAKIEKWMLSSSTKKIQYQRGKILTKKNKRWKKAVSLPLTAASVPIAKKGWYTFRITDTSGKKKLHKVKLKKKNYMVTANTPVKKKAGLYHLIPKSAKTEAVEAKNGAHTEGSGIAVDTTETAAFRVWQIEPAGGKRFRLKNVNSGLYLGVSDSGKKAGTKMIQKVFSATDAGILFEAARADGSYYYIKCLGSGRYLHTKGSTIDCRKRKNNKAWKYKIKKAQKPISKMSVYGYTYPTSVLFGTPFVLRGTVASDYTMTALTASVVDSKGKTVLQKTVNPNGCYYDLKGVDAAMTFGKLAAGSYYYRVQAKDTCGTVITVINRGFNVYVPAITNGKRLSYNAALINKIGHQSTGSDLEKKACASYALAYCNSILHGTAPSPHSYWMSSTTVDCMWSKGDYTTYAYASESAVLQAAYAQINAGKPCILHVTGNTSQHWVTIIGYQNVKSIYSLSAANFIAIDPWDGAVITVSDKYKVKNTYRLGYKAS